MSDKKKTPKPSCMCGPETVCFKHLGWRRNAVLAAMSKGKK